MLEKNDAATDTHVKEPVGEGLLLLRHYVVPHLWSMSHHHHVFPVCHILLVQFQQ